MKAWTSATSAACRREPGANGPNRLIGNNEVRATATVGQRAVKLTANHSQCLARLTLRALFADADYRSQAGPPGCLSLGTYLGVGLVMVGAPLRMPNNHCTCTGVRQHLSRNVASVRA